jgi:sortase (surface protein transpeptidase)
LLTTSRPGTLPSLPSPTASALPEEPSNAPRVGSISPVIPRWLVIPAIGVSAPIIPEGLDEAGALQLPPLKEKNVTAWWSGGPAPGQNGAAVIAGHVDSALMGPLVFWRLHDLRAGDRIEIRPESLVFVVTRIAQVAKTSFPTLAVYGPTVGSQLRLITCGGSFDSDTGEYLDNVIVYARLAATR